VRRLIVTKAWARHLTGTATGAPKYRNRATVIDGVRFDSRKEARRFGELQLLAAAGMVAELEVHPRFLILIDVFHRTGGPPICCGSYTADFRYRDMESGALVVEDVKSPPTRTTAYRLRKRLVEAIYGITIREV
jgi:hypothetical protein